MGGRAGKGGLGLNSGGGLKSGATERGMSQKLQKAVLDKEGRIMRNPSESLHAFDDNGKETYQAFSEPGNPYEVKYDAKSVKDKVVTHNHPRGLNKTGWESMGSSLGGEDIKGMVKSDMKELRAVTSKYTYSMKRPAKGWGVSAKQVEAHYKKLANSMSSKDFRFMSKYKGTFQQWEQANSRLKATFFHRVNKQVAKDFGWTYTKKKN